MGLATVFAGPGEVLPLAVAGVAVLIFVTWLVSLRLRDASIIDPVWGPAFVLVALIAALAWGMALLFELLTLVHVIALPPGVSLRALAFLLIPLSGAVFAGLIYAVTYLCTMLIPRDKTARVISVAVLIAYAYLYVKANRSWGGVTQYLFPTWWVDPFPYQYSSAVAPHVWLELGARVIAIVVLLLAAQLVLERREIRA